MAADTERDLAAAVLSLEQRVTALERPAQRPGPPTAAGGRWWISDEMERRATAASSEDEVRGELAFAAYVSAPGAGTLRRQIERPVAAVLGADFDAAANVLGALGHPLRLEIVRRLLRGARTLADLQEIAGLGTSGQLHHHLRELRGAGIVVSRRRNDYAVAGDWVAAVLVIIAGALGSEP